MQESEKESERERENLYRIYTILIKYSIIHGTRPRYRRMCELFLKCFSNSIVTYAWTSDIRMCVRLYAFLSLLFRPSLSEHYASLSLFFSSYRGLLSEQQCEKKCDRECVIFSGFICPHFVILQNITPLKSVIVAPVSQSHQ